MRGISQPGTLDFCHTLVLLGIFNRSNFKYSTFSDLKVDSAEENKTRKKVDNAEENKTRKKIFLSAISMYQLSRDLALNLQSQNLFIF